MCPGANKLLDMLTGPARLYPDSEATQKLALAQGRKPAGRKNAGRSGPAAEGLNEVKASRQRVPDRPDGKGGSRRSQ